MFFTPSHRWTAQPAIGEQKMSFVENNFAQQLMQDFQSCACHVPILLGEREFLAAILLQTSSLLVKRERDCMQHDHEWENILLSSSSLFSLNSFCFCYLCIILEELFFIPAPSYIGVSAACWRQRQWVKGGQCKVFGRPGCWDWR